MLTRLQLLFIGKTGHYFTQFSICGIFHQKPSPEAISKAVLWPSNFLPKSEVGDHFLGP